MQHSTWPDFEFIMSFIPAQDHTVAIATEDELWWVTDSWQISVRMICHIETQLSIAVSPCAFPLLKECLSFSHSLSASPSLSAQNSYNETDFRVCRKMFTFQSDLNFKEIWASKERRRGKGEKKQGNESKETAGLRGDDAREEMKTLKERVTLWCVKKGLTQGLGFRKEKVKRAHTQLKKWFRKMP